MKRFAADLAAVAVAETTHSETQPVFTTDQADLLVAAHRLRAKGWTEQACMAFMADVARETPRVGRRLRRMSDTQLERRLSRYSSRQAALAQHRRRGDLIQLRSDPRWPWRTAT